MAAEPESALSSSAAICDTRALLNLANLWPALISGCLISSTTRLPRCHWQRERRAERHSNEMASHHPGLSLFLLQCKHKTLSRVTPRICPSRHTGKSAAAPVSSQAESTSLNGLESMWDVSHSGISTYSLLTLDLFQPNIGMARHDGKGL